MPCGATSVPALAQESHTAAKDDGMFCKGDYFTRIVNLEQIF